MPIELRPQLIVYRKGGGIAGLEWTLEVRDGLRLVVTDRRLGTLPERELTAEEQSDLERCLDALGESAHPPTSVPGDPHVSDAFHVSVHLDDAAAPALTASSPMLPITGAGAWDPLLSWLDARLREALESGPAS